MFNSLEDLNKSLQVAMRERGHSSNTDWCSSNYIVHSRGNFCTSFAIVVVVVEVVVSPQ